MCMKRFLVFVVLGLAWVRPAHAALYYEFNPDYSQSLLVATSDTVSEVFLPLNDFLGALDFWVSNASSSGDVTFTLYNPSGTAMAERTIAVLPIGDDAVGKRLHVNLPVQFAVTGNAPYRVRIATTNPTLRLYYADSTQLIAHNGSPVAAYAGGLARIGTNDMGFSFKFALYENQESVPPQLTGVTVNQISPDQTTITFNANEPVDRHVQYGGQTIDFDGDYTSCAPTISVCTVTLAVSPGTTYTFTLTVKDVWGNQAAATGTFTTLSDNSPQTPTPTPVITAPSTSTPIPTATPIPDSTAPIISNLRIVSLAPRTATFAWTTNEAANSTVVVQFLPDLINAGGNLDDTQELEHFIVVNNLPSDAALRAFISSFDGTGNKGAAFVDFVSPHDAAGPGTTTTPSPTPVPPVVTGPPDSPTISWTPPASGPPTDGYRIDVFDAANNLVKTITVPAGQLSVALGTLPIGENRIVIYADNDGTFEKVAAPIPVVVRVVGFWEHLIALLPYILGGVVIIIIAVVVSMKLRKRKPSAATPPPEPMSGARSNPATF